MKLMPHEAFTISSTNPNDAAGGGGCACSPLKVGGCKGPYAIFRGPGTEQPLSPYNVIGIKCLQSAAEKIDGEPAIVGQEDEFIAPSEETVERFLVKPRKVELPKV